MTISVEEEIRNFYRQLNSKPPIVLSDDFSRTELDEETTLNMYKELYLGMIERTVRRMNEEDSFDEIFSKFHRYHHGLKTSLEDQGIDSKEILHCKKVKESYHKMAMEFMRVAIEKMRTPREEALTK